MHKHNFIEKWKPVIIFSGIAAFMVVVCLAAWLLSGDDDGTDDPIVNVTIATDNVEQNTSQPDQDVTEPSVPEATKPTLPEVTKPLSPEETKPLSPEATEPTSPEVTKPTSPEVIVPSLPDDPQSPTTGPAQPETTEPVSPPNTGTTDPPTSIIPHQNRLSCDKIAVFSGRFVEDGSDKPVENVVSLLITNQSDEFLDMATIQYSVDGKTANFIVTGLPARESCWVMEYSGMTITADSSVEYVGCNTSFKENVVDSTKDITISAVGNLLTAKNNTSRTLENVFIYYKTVHTDGNYFGGITYMVNFGTLRPGESVEKLGGHYSEEDSKIVRIGWQERQSD